VKPDRAKMGAAVALASLSLSVLLPSLATSIANVSLPTLAKVFNASFQEVQWVVVAYLLAITALIVGAGRLGDIVGRKRLLLSGMAVFSAASLLCGLASSLWLLVVARAVQGLGAAAMMALAMAFVGAVVPKGKTGSALGLLGSMSAIGTALGPSIGGLLIAGLGWRAIFLINAPLSLLAMALAYRALPPDQVVNRQDHPGFDVKGTLLLAGTLGCYALAMTSNMRLMLLALLGATCFVVVERRAPVPLIRLALFRDALLSSGLATSALVSTVVMATLVVGPFYLSQSLGLDAAGVGLAMSVGPIAAALTGMPAGRAVDRFGTAGMTILGLLGMGGGATMLAVSSAAGGVVAYLGPMVVITVSYALFQTANNTAVMAEMAPEQRGVMSGMLNLSRYLGLITGASFMGAVFTVASAAADVSTASSEAVGKGMHATFAVAALVIVLALIVALGGALMRFVSGTCNR
jgi:MFS family permease